MVVIGEYQVIGGNGRESIRPKGIDLDYAAQLDGFMANYLI
jgi:hypothetical protein